MIATIIALATGIIIIIIIIIIIRGGGYVVCIATV